MPVELLILDFDGTFTDAEAEAVPFVVAFRADVFDLLGQEPSAEWAEEERRIMESPQDFGWTVDGAIAAPANVDPFIRATCTAQNMFDRHGVLKNAETRSAVLQGFYRKNYPLTLSAPRPDAKAVLEKALQGSFAVQVVTNSRGDAVEEKIKELAPAGFDKLAIVGDAKKFVYEPSPRDARFDSLGELELPGMKRPVLLKRGHYYDVLSEAWARTGATAETTVVCGDIFELDLALPLALGARVHLLDSDHTPEYERRFLESHERASYGRTLSSILDIVGQ